MRCPARLGTSSPGTPTRWACPCDSFPWAPAEMRTSSSMTEPRAVVGSAAARTIGVVSTRRVPLVAGRPIRPLTLGRVGRAARRSIRGPRRDRCLAAGSVRLVPGRTVGRVPRGSIRGVAARTVRGVPRGSVHVAGSSRGAHVFRSVVPLAATVVGAGLTRGVVAMAARSALVCAGEARQEQTEGHQGHQGGVGEGSISHGRMASFRSGSRRSELRLHRGGRTPRAPHSRPEAGFVNGPRT
jgi:hypothetical protein